MATSLFHKFLALVIVAAVTVLTPLPARAAFVFCNQTKITIEAAFGHRDDKLWVSEGWWQIQPGQCSRVLNKPLKQRFYFYYARELPSAAPVDGSRKPLIWSGKYPLCSNTKAFRIEGDNDCEKRDYRVTMFQGIDIGTVRRDYTLNFQDDNANR